jgi:hypothetical protein
VPLKRKENTAHPEEGGGITVSLDGTPTGSAPRDILNFRQSSPGVSVTALDDPPNDEGDITITTQGMQLLASFEGIDALANGNTTIYTVPAGVTLLTAYAVVRCTAASAISNAAVAGIGSNGAADNVFTSQLLSGLTLAGLRYVFPVGGVLAEVPASTPVLFGIDAAAVGTSQTLAVDLIGRLI